MQEKKRDFVIQDLEHSGFEIIKKYSFEEYEKMISGCEEVEVKSEEPERAALSKEEKKLVVLYRKKGISAADCLISTDKLIGLSCMQKAQYGPGQEYLGDMLTGTPIDSVHGIPSSMVITVKEYRESVQYDPQSEEERIILPPKYVLYLTQRDISNE